MAGHAPLLVRRVVPIQLGVACVALGLTLAATLSNALELDERSLSLHVAIDTTAMLVSVLAAYLVGGRFRDSRRIDYLLLFAALIALSFASATALIGDATSADDADQYLVWSALVVRLTASALLAAAAFASDRTIDDAPRLAAALRVGAIFVLLLVAVLVVVQPHLETGIDPMLAPAEPGDLAVVGTPGFVAFQFAILVLLIAGAVGFTLRTVRSGDEFMGWLAVGLTFGVFARINFILFPSNFTDWVFAGDLLRLAFFVAILLGALRQIRTYQRSAAEAAVLEERQRIARDLHDTVAQDLAFIASRGRELGGTSPELARIAGVAESALASSRGAIVAFSASPDEPLGTAIGRLAPMLATRAGCRVTLAVQDEVHLTRPAHDALVRIVSEAISNAVRHARPSEITVSLVADDDLTLIIADDGIGIDSADSTPSAGFGLGNMTHRVEALGGTLSFAARPEGGTSVEIRIPAGQWDGQAAG